MSLLPWRKERETEHPLTSLRDEMNRLFDGFFDREPWAQAWAPALDVAETEKALVVKAEVPGIEAKQLEISLNGNVLAISGKREQEKETKDKAWHRVERSFGSFARTVSLPAEVDPAKVNAECKDGILTITLPKLESAQPRKIQVKVK